MEGLTCDRTPILHARPCHLRERSELGRGDHDTDEDLVDKTMNVSGLSFVLLREGRCHLAELLRLLSLYIELLREHCASNHSEERPPIHKPGKRELPE